jgi:hypothetical protein
VFIEKNLSGNFDWYRFFFDGCNIAACLDAVINYMCIYSSPEDISALYIS